MPFDINYSNIKDFNVENLKTREQCELVSSKCNSASRWEVVKSAGYTALAVSTSAAMVMVALSVAKIAAILAALITLPLAVFPPLHAIVIIAAALIAGAAAGYYGVNTSWNFFMDHAKTHWNRSEAYSNKATAADFQKTTL